MLRATKARPHRDPGRTGRRKMPTEPAHPGTGAPAKFFARARYYDHLTGVFSISRRYFVIGAFDGALTILGLVLGAAGHSTDATLILAAGLATSVALAVSSTFGAFEAERVEQDLERQGLESAMLTEVRGDMVAALHFATRLSSLVHGVAPMVSGLLPLIPFIFVPALISFDQAIVLSVVTTMGFLFFLGAYLGTITKKHLAISGLRLIVVALATALITVLIGYHG